MQRILSIFLAALTAVVVTPAPVAAQIYDCTRTFVSIKGLRSSRTAEQLFPPESAFQVVGEEARSNIYGTGRVLRAQDPIMMAFDVPTQSNDIIPIRLTFDRRTGRYHVTVSLPSGYEQIAGGGGQCRERG